MQGWTFCGIRINFMASRTQKFFVTHLIVMIIIWFWMLALDIDLKKNPPKNVQDNRRAHWVCTNSGDQVVTVLVLQGRVAAVCGEPGQSFTWRQPQPDHLPVETVHPSRPLPQSAQRTGTAHRGGSDGCVICTVCPFPVCAVSFAPCCLHQSEKEMQIFMCNGLVKKKEKKKKKKDISSIQPNISSTFLLLYFFLIVLNRNIVKKKKKKCVCM